jgi:hypothetical protein
VVVLESTILVDAVGMVVAIVVVGFMIFVVLRGMIASIKVLGFSVVEDVVVVVLL